MGTTLQDDITKANARICKHMNDDHKISIIAYCDYYGGVYLKQQPRLGNGAGGSSE